MAPDRTRVHYKGRAQASAVSRPAINIGGTLTRTPDDSGGAGANDCAGGLLRELR
jgi:hypothetical protein